MKVLVATDGSQRAMKAVRKSRELAEKEGADVTLLSVAYFFRSEVDDVPADALEYLIFFESRAAIEKAKSVFDEKGFRVNTRLEKGLVPANVILKVAKEGKFDHVMLGSTGKTGIKRYLMRSTTSKVVARAPCSVTVLR